MNVKARFVLPVALLTFAAGAAAQQKRVYIANDDHTDYVWNCSEATNRQAFLDMLDYYVAQKDATAANPSDSQSRFSADSSLWLRVYETSRTQAQFDRLIAVIRSGHITAPLTTLVSTYGGTPAEGVIRGMYYAGSLERRYGLRFPLAMAMENQTMPWGLASLWAGSGARYSWRGVCGCVTRTPFQGTRDQEVFWYTGPDGQRVMLKWYSAASSSPDSNIGGYAEARFVSQAVDYVTVNAPFNGFAARHPYDVIGVFGHGWDNNSSITSEFVTLAPQLSNAQRRVIVSNELDYFHDMETTYGGVLGTVDYSYGNEWELYQASMAELTARVRRALEQSRGAEAIAAVVSTVDPAFMNGREADRLAFNLGLGMYWEHDWTGDGGFATEKQALQRRLAADIERYVTTLQADSVAALGSMISPTPGLPAGQQVFVFNPLGWTRSDAADVPWNLGGPVSVWDLSTGAPGVETPSQLVTVDGQPRVRFWAADLPSVGYKVYQIRQVAGQAFPPAATVTDGPGTPGTATATYTIETDNRDAHSLNSGGSQLEVRVSGYGVGDQHDYWGTDGEQQTAGVEFAVAVPPGTVITGAHLVLRASPGSSPTSTGAMRIRAYDIDDAPPFASGFTGDLALRFPMMPGQILWAAPSWPGGSTQASPDLTPLVQAFVNRPGYAPGKHLGLVIDEGTLPPNVYYGFEDFAKPGGQPAQLVVTYQSGAGTVSTSKILENDRYRVTVTSAGTISSLVDKIRANRDFAANIGGQTLNDLGSQPNLGTLTIENAGPVSVTLKAVSASPLNHESRITLQHAGERIDVHNRITQNFTEVREWAYSFNLTNPTVWHEEVGAVALARPRTSPGGSYATQNARLDYLTLNHFADISGAGNVGVTLSNIDCAFFRLGNSDTTFMDTATPRLSPLAGGRVDAGLGLPNQGGDTLFTQRFALRTRSSYDQPAAMRFAMEHANPLITGVVTGSLSSLPAGSFSLVTVDDPSVLLWTLKPSEEGINHPTSGGLIVRVWNVSESPVSSALHLNPSGIASARRVTHVESDIADAGAVAGSLPISLARQQLATYRLIPAPPTPPTCPADFNGDGDVNPDDLGDFITCYFTEPPCPRADFNSDFDVNPDDLGDFITTYFGPAC